MKVKNRDVAGWHVLAVVLGPVLAATAVLLVALWLRDEPRTFDVRVEPWGCATSVDWATLTEADKIALGDALNACTREHFPGSDVVW